jgi:ATP phosphoribosyltransferase regulatory subunit
LTLFPDAVLRVAPPRTPRPRVFIPFGASRDDAAGLRRAGYATVEALDATGEPQLEAARLGCSHILRGSSAEPLTTGD